MVNKRYLFIISGIFMILIGAAFAVYRLFLIKDVSDTGKAERETKVKSSIIVFQTFKGLPNKGNVMFPVFSPDGGLIAFTRSWPEKSSDPEWRSKAGESGFRIEIGVYNVETEETTIYMSFNSVEYYSIYGSFVAGLQWLDSQRLSIEIGDGDVGYTDIVFNIASRKLEKEKYIGDAMEEESILTEGEKAAVAKAKELFPEITDWKLMELNIKDNGLIIPEKGIIILKDFAGEDKGLWFLDFAERQAKQLLDLPEELHFYITLKLPLIGRLNKPNFPFRHLINC